jgi:hypothetical protein
MTIQDWGAIGEIAGALLVGFTLIYLAIQLRQNTVSVETSALSGWITARIAINEAFSKLDGATVHEGMRDSRRLTESDSVAFGLMFQTYMMHGQVTHLLFKRGLIPRDLWETEMAINAGLLAPPGVRQWWEAGGRGQVTPEFAKLVESTPPGPTFGWAVDRGYVALAEALDEADPEEEHR